MTTPTTAAIVILSMLMLGGDTPKRDVISPKEANRICRILRWSAYEIVMQRRDEEFHLIELDETLRAVQVGIRNENPKLLELMTIHMRACVMACWQTETLKNKRKGTR